MQNLLRLLFLCVACSLTACAGVWTNPVKLGRTMSKAEALQTLHRWIGAEVVDVPDARQIPRRRNGSRPSSQHKLVQVDEHGLTYTCAYAKIDDTSAVPAGYVTIIKTYFHMEPGSNGRLDFSKVARIQNYRSNSGTGWAWVALSDASGQRLIKFYREPRLPYGRQDFGEKVRNMETLAAAFVALCPNAR